MSEPLLVSCPQCREDFASPTRRRYCSPRCRDAAYRERVTDRAGEQWSAEDTTFGDFKDFVTPCYYCGLTAETVDHVRPRSLGDRAKFFSKNNLPPNVTVPACRECNSALGSRYFRTLKERKEWLKSWLRKRYRSLLNSPYWSDSELARLSGALRIHVVSRQQAAATAWARVRW